MEKEKKRKTLDEILKEAIKNAPSIEGYTIRNLVDVIHSPWPRPRQFPEPYELGTARIMRIKRKKRQDN